MVDTTTEVDLNAGKALPSLSAYGQKKRKIKQGVIDSGAKVE
jgi:hypothetical protein